MNWRALGIMFMFGAFGGVMPTLAKVATTYVTNPATPLPEIGLFMGLLLWAIVGGGIAITNHQQEVRQAIFAGIAAPAILSNIATGAAEGAMKPKNTASAEISFFVALLTSSGIFQPAMAQTPPAKGNPETSTTGSWGTAGPSGDIRNNSSTWKPWPTDPKTSQKNVVIFDPNVQGGLPTRTAIPVSADVTTGNNVERVYIGTITELTGDSAFILPPNIKYLFVGGKPVAFSDQGTKVDLDVVTKPKPSGDFLWALGLPRDYTITDVNPKISKKREAVPLPKEGG